MVVSLTQLIWMGFARPVDAVTFAPNTTPPKPRATPRIARNEVRAAGAAAARAALPTLRETSACAERKRRRLASGVPPPPPPPPPLDAAGGTRCDSSGELWLSLAAARS